MEFIGIGYEMNQKEAAKQMSMELLGIINRLRNNPKRLETLMLQELRATALPPEDILEIKQFLARIT